MFQMKSYRNLICASLLLSASLTAAVAQRSRPGRSAPEISPNILVRILRAEDERRWDDSLKSLLSDKDAKVRKRAALAAGRIGDEHAVPTLVDLLKTDTDNDVRQMAAFAIGEVESFAGAEALYRILVDTSVPRAISARALEAVGKIAAALPDSDKEHKQEIGKGILGVLNFEADPRVSMDRLTVLLGLTAALRAKPEGAGPVVVKFLKSGDPRIVAAALNTMARLRLKDNNEEVRALLKHADPIVRANAARVIGVAEDKGAFDAVLDRALHDEDLRVRVSAIRALGALKDERAAEPLIAQGSALLTSAAASRLERPGELNEILEISTTLGLVLKNAKTEKALIWLKKVRATVNETSPAVEVSLVRISPQDYVAGGPFLRDARGGPTYIGALRQMSQAQGLTELAAAKTGEPMLDNSNKEVATKLIQNALECRQVRTPRDSVKPGLDLVLVGTCAPLESLAVPDFLRAYAAFKRQDLGETLTPRLKDKDVIIRATAAELLGEMTPGEANSRALIQALPVALRDKDLNDAALAILDALGKQKSAAANEAIKTGLDSSDHLIRRKAVAVLKANGAGDFSNRIGYVQTTNKEADYRRAIARIGRKVTATVVTSKGQFVIEFLPEEAPLTVDNFVMLARRGYFNGQTVPRVVPNFVIQTGDPRGDQNGGPGYSIRCEINEAPYDRAAVGMALSGKDTGGSQWFVTHSPQPHLDGGYTVFGHVVSGMDVVDRIARGDTIRRVIVNER